MCIRDRGRVVIERDGWVFPDTLVGTDSHTPMINGLGVLGCCLLYTSDAADERSSVDLGGRRIIKKKKKIDNNRGETAQ